MGVDEPENADETSGGREIGSPPAGCPADGEAPQTTPSPSSTSVRLAGHRGLAIVVTLALFVAVGIGSGWLAAQLASRGLDALGISPAAVGEVSPAASDTMPAEGTPAAEDDAAPAGREGARPGIDAHEGESPEAGRSEVGDAGALGALLGGALSLLGDGRTA